MVKFTLVVKQADARVASVWHLLYKQSCDASDKKAMDALRKAYRTHLSKHPKGSKYQKGPHSCTLMLPAR